MSAKSLLKERCAICGCLLHRGSEYGKPTVKGRSHATKHHCVAKRFFGHSKSGKNKKTSPIFPQSPWNLEGETQVLCYECHEELLHNPVFLPADIEKFRALAQDRGLDEESKPRTREGIAGRIKLLQEAIQRGIEETLNESQCKRKSKNLNEDWLPDMDLNQ